MSFNDLDLRELDKDLLPKEKEEWNDIYSSYRGSSILTKRVSGVDRIKYEENIVNCLVSIDYRVKVLHPRRGGLVRQKCSTAGLCLKIHERRRDRLCDNRHRQDRRIRHSIKAAGA